MASIDWWVKTSVVPGDEPAAIGEWAKASVNEQGLPLADVFVVSSEKDPTK